MIQRKIEEISINTSGNVSYTPDMEEEYAAVLAQAEAHQDLRFRYNDKILILPWETVSEVYATYETADVTAPTDTICGGEAESPLVLTLISPKDTCYNADGANIFSFTITYDCGAEEDCHASQNKDGEFNWTIVKQVMFNGEDHTDDENVEGTYELTLANGVATLTMTVSYEGYTASQSLTASAECSNIGG